MSDLVDGCPIMTLPDEVLCEIFSLITDIPFKMNLETVCKRFQRISTTQTNSWKGNDKLELIAGCNSFHNPLMDYLTDCASYQFYNSYLSGQGMPLMNNWVNAIDQLLQRAVVHKLCIHISSLPNDDHLLFLHQVFEVLQNHSSHLRLTHIEMHNRRVEFGGGTDLQQLCDDLYLWAVSDSVKTLESVVLSLADDLPQEKWGLLFAGIEACLNLKAFSIIWPEVMYDHAAPFLMQLSDALQGKPLNSVTFGNQVINPQVDLHPLAQLLLPICQNARGYGITSLRVAFPAMQPYGLVDLANALHPPTVHSLSELWITNTSINHILPDLNRLPATFPMLKELRLVAHSWSDLDEDLLLNTQFFTACDETPLVDRKVYISYLEIIEEDEFRASIAVFCDEEEVQAVYGEVEGESWVTLKKGRGTIEIKEIGEPEVSAFGPDMSDFGDDMVDEFIDYDEEDFWDGEGDYDDEDDENDDLYP